MAVACRGVRLAGPSQPPFPGTGCARQAPGGGVALPVVGLGNGQGQGHRGTAGNRPLAITACAPHRSAAAATATAVSQSRVAEASSESRGSSEGDEGTAEQTAATPLLSTLTQCAEDTTVPLHFPGHKKGKGAPPQALQAFGQRVFQHDLPELPELDNLFAPEGVLKEAQERAAAAFGAAETFFLVNGTTVGLQAAIMALCCPGQSLILPRNAHQSAFSAAILSGARPVYLVPPYDQALEHPAQVGAEVVAAAIRAIMAAGRGPTSLVAAPSSNGEGAAGTRETWDPPLQDQDSPENQRDSGLGHNSGSRSISGQGDSIGRAPGPGQGHPNGSSSPVPSGAGARSPRPRIGAVLIVSPTYFGAASDVAAIARVCREAGVPLVVDEAHGGHFAFCPELPPSALEAGADIVVQSTHKVLGSLTQSAMLHINKNSTVLGPADIQRVQRSLQLLQSSSPSYLLLASLDAAAAQVSCPLWAQSLSEAVALARRTMDRLAGIPGLEVYRPASGSPGSAPHGGQERGTGTDSNDKSSSTDSTEENNRIMETEESSSQHSHEALTEASATGPHDPLRITVLVRGLGRTGFEVDDELREAFGVVAELPCVGSITFALGVGTTRSDADRLVHAFEELSAKYRVAPPTAAQAQLLLQGEEAKGTGGTVSASPHRAEGEGPLTAACSRALAQGPASLSLPEMKLIPREAFFASSEVVSATEAVGRLSASLLCPYPPGIPVLVPGEVISLEAVQLLQELAAAGASVNGAEDDDLRTFSVVCD